MENQLEVRITVDAKDITTVYKAADVLKVHYVTVYRMVKRGLLHAIPIGDQTYLSIKEVNQLKEKRDKENTKIK
ncbi:MAG: helix-turn-helix domain-containing protein [Dehalococcoidia bacterium]|jgi:excisionase family DNA binding protein